MKKRHVNIPVFIPHLGCPNDCVFCNQRIISGVAAFDPNSVIPIIEDSLKTLNGTDDAEIAFFGGSFTGIDRDLMINLLKIANGYLIQGRINSIRCSTRPDYINEDIVKILLEYGVNTVELGIQSVSGSVLSACSRGHSFEDTRRACELIKESGLRLGGQMMIGLPGATADDEINTARFIASAGADEARIYPTIVFKSTELCRMTESGAYVPLSVDAAVERAAEAFGIFIDSGVKVLRVGLCDSENLHSDKTYFAGPNHAAMGELVEGEYYFRHIKDKLAELASLKNKSITLRVPVGHTSKVIGHNKKNKIRLSDIYSLRGFKVIESREISGYEFSVKIEERK